MNVELEQWTPTAKAGNVLTAHDRCDRCGAQAWVIAILESGYCLYFCSHHFNKVEEALCNCTIGLVDERFRIA